MRVGRRIEVCAWLLGIALLGSYAGARTSLEIARTIDVEVFVASTAASEAPADQIHTAFAGLEVDQSLWSEERISAFADNPTTQEDVKAVLRIPAVELEVPVYSGSTDANLNRGAAHIEGTGALTGHTGNVGIAAHRDGFFRKLKDVAIDDELHLALEGQILRYRVVDLAVVLPHEVDVLAPTDLPSVTLVTCYPFYFVGTAPQRYIVRAQRDDVSVDGPGAAVEEASGITDDLHARTTRKSHEL